MGEEFLEEKANEDRVIETKKGFRKEMIEKRKEIPGDEVAKKSEIIKDKFIGYPEYKNADIIMVYLSFKNEVDTMPIIEKALGNSKKITVPKTYPKTKKMIPALIKDLEEDVTIGNYGIPEPRDDKLSLVDPTDVDLVVVPGVAFDLDGYRLGYGGGYYDRFISELREDVILAAVSFEEQIVDKVPLNKWDKKVHLVFTEKRVIDVRE